MDKLRNKELEMTYKYHKFISDTSIYIKTQVKNRRKDTTFLTAINFPFLGEIKEEKSLEKIFDEIDQKNFESSFIGLVAVFEKIIFTKFGNAYGEIKKLVKEKYVSPKPMYKHGEHFIKDVENTDSLAAIKNIISHQLPKEVLTEFDEIITHRNVLAHGKRFGKSATILTLEQVTLVLDEVLAIVNEK